MGSSPYAFVVFGAKPSYNSECAPADIQPTHQPHARTPTSQLATRWHPGVLNARLCPHSTFTLAAIGDYDHVFAATSSISNAYPNRGAFWYFVPGRSMGFA